MKLNVSANLDDPYIQIGPYFPNIGNFEIGVPDHINTLFASIRLDIVDYYGNKSYAYSSGYFTLGNPNLITGLTSDYRERERDDVLP